MAINPQADHLVCYAKAYAQIGPRYLWNSTGARLNLTNYRGFFVVRDAPGGAVLFSVSSLNSTSKGILRFSNAVSGAYHLKFKPPATSGYGGVDASYILELSAPAGPGRLVFERGTLAIRHR